MRANICDRNIWGQKNKSGHFSGAHGCRAARATTALAASDRTKDAAGNPHRPKNQLRLVVPPVCVRHAQAGIYAVPGLRNPPPADRIYAERTA